MGGTRPLDHIRWHRRIVAWAYGVALSRCHVPPTDPAVLVAMPLVGAAHAVDWQGTVDRLGDTLAAFAAGRRPPTAVYLCGQTCPPGYPFRPHERWVEAPDFGPPKHGNDAPWKLRMIFREIARAHPSFAYVLRFDADDIPHPALIDHIATDNNGRGYLVEDGFMVSEDRQLARLGTAAGEARFWQYCGSCVAFAVDFARQPFAHYYAMRFAHRHHQFRCYAALHGYPLAPVPFPAALYRFDHSGSTSIRFGREGGRRHYASLNAVSPEEAKRHLREFNYLPGSALRPTSAWVVPGSQRSP